MNIIRIITVLLSLFTFSSVMQAQEPSGQRELLKQYLSDLQKNPDDYALREKIIKLVLELKPPPAVPEEARRPFMKGVTFMKEATSVSDFELAINVFKEALLLAPWWPDAYYNMALAQESAGKFDDGIRSLKLYLLTNPKDAEEARDKIYSLEAKKELAVKKEAKKKTEEAEKKAEVLIREGSDAFRNTPCTGRQLITIKRWLKFLSARVLM